MDGSKAIFKYTVPDDLVIRFSRIAIVKRLGIEVVKEPGRIHHFDGSPSEIVLYIFSAALLRDLIPSIIHDLLKNGIKFLWVSLSTITWKKAFWRRVLGNKIHSKTITLILSTPDRDIEFIFRGFVTDNQATKIIQECIETVNSDRLDQIFNNPDYLDNAEKPKIRLGYDFITRVWVPENFGAQRLKLKEIRNAARRLSS